MLARARREIDTMQAFESHYVVHKSFTGLCTTAALDGSIRSDTTSQFEANDRYGESRKRSAARAWGGVRRGTSHAAIGT
jgi:hypothetical protein